MCDPRVVIIILLCVIKATILTSVSMRVPYMAKRPGKEVKIRKPLRTFPRVVYDISLISRMTENPCCLPLMELYGGFLVLIPVVQI